MDDQPTDYIQQVSSTSPDFKTELAKKLQEVVPEAITDGKVDTKKLKELLDDDAADDSERFGLFWPGKKRATRAAQEPTTATLKPSKGESKDWDTTQNLFIEGDNLEVLKIMQKQYHNKIKMIYIDPPYNTGKDFVYPDNFKEGLRSYLEFTNQVGEDGRKINTNSDSDGRYHSNWLNMMYPRLKLARNLLKSDGFIFISIDYHEAENLKKICNEIFGELNFRGEIVRATGTTTGQDANKIGSSYDFCLCYSRMPTSKLTGIPLIGKDLNRFNNDDNDGKGKYALLQLRKTGNADRKEDRENMFYSVSGPDGSKVYPIGPEESYLSRWRVGSKTYQKLVEANLIVWKSINDIVDDEEGDEEFEAEIDGPLVEEGESNSGIDEIDAQNIKQFVTNWKPYVKYYLSGRSKQVSNLWTDVDGNKKGSIELKSLFDNKKVFDNPKPTDFISRLVQISCNNGDIVMDFFAGSNSTAHAITKYNASFVTSITFIVVQLPEPTYTVVKNKEKPIKSAEIAYALGYRNIADIGKERIRRAGERIKLDYADQLTKRETAIDVGFRVYKLADSNFSKWHTSSDIGVDDLQQRLIDMRESSDDNASQDDLLTEILLKLGVSLTTKAVQKDISGLQAWDVGNGAIAAYLDEHTKPNLNQLRAVVDTAPAKFVILEDAFQGDDELKTNLSQICKTNKIELWTV